MPTLDLHGFRVDDVYDALDRFIRDAEAKGHERVRIITGKGTGKVRDKAMEYLRIAHYAPKAENEGSFWIAI